jgi:hypothetical protein
MMLREVMVTAKKNAYLRELETCIIYIFFSNFLYGWIMNTRGPFLVK